MVYPGWRVLDWQAGYGGSEPVTSAKICKGWIKNLVESHKNILLECMTNRFNKIKEELAIYYPGVTDDELETMTQKLITFFKLSAKAVYEAKKAEIPLNDIRDS